MRLSSMAPKAKPENKSKTVPAKVRSHLVKAIAPAVNPSGVIKSKGSRIMNGLPKLYNKLGRWLLWYYLSRAPTSRCWGSNRTDACHKAGSLDCTEQSRVLASGSLADACCSRKASDAYQHGDVEHFRTCDYLRKL